MVIRCWSALMILLVKRVIGCKVEYYEGVFLFSDNFLIGSKMNR